MLSSAGIEGTGNPGARAKLGAGAAVAAVAARRRRSGRSGGRGSWGQKTWGDHGDLQRFMGIFYPKYGKIYWFGGQEDRKQKTGRLGTDMN